jgi:hypothetical protein
MFQLPSDIKHLIFEFAYGDPKENKTKVLHEIKTKAMVVELFCIDMENGVNNVPMLPTGVIEFHNDWGYGTPHDDVQNRYYVLEFWNLVLKMDLDRYMDIYDTIF